MRDFILVIKIRGTALTIKAFGMAIGIFTDTYVQVHKGNKAKIKELITYFNPLFEEDISKYGLCSLSEIKNGNSLS